MSVTPGFCGHRFFFIFFFICASIDSNRMILREKIQNNLKSLHVYIFTFQNIENKKIFSCGQGVDPRPIVDPQLLGFF